MQIVVVKGPRSKLCGVKTRCCKRLTVEGEAVIVDRLTTYGFANSQWIAHADCLAALAAKAPDGVAPKGVPARSVTAQIEEMRERAIEIAAA